MEQNNDKIYNNQNNSNLNEEIINLKNELKNKNEIIEQQKEKILNLQNQLNHFNNSNILNNNSNNIIQNLQNNINKKEQELLSLKNELKIKNEELNKLKFNDNNIINSNKDGKAFAINFMSVNQEILYPLLCRSDDTIVKLEEQLYNEYPKYKDYNTYLTVNGSLVKRFKTVEENGIKKGNAVIVNIYE